MAINIIENLLTPEVPKMLDNEQIHVYVPNASYDNVGIASYDSDDFIIVNNKVSVKTATDTIRGLASFGLEFTVVNGHVQLSTSFYQGIDNKILAHNNDPDTHAPAINKKINHHAGDTYAHAIAFNQHNTIVGKHTRDHANTLQSAKDYTNSVSGALNTTLRDEIDYVHQDALGELSAHLASLSDHPDIRGTLLYILAVLQGKSRTFVIETLDQLVYFLANNSGITVPMVNEQTGASEQISLNILDLIPGDTFLIRDRSVPDFWWDNTIDDMWFPIDTDINLTGVHPTTGAVIGGMQILETDYAVVEGYLASASLKAAEAKEYRDEALLYRTWSENFSNMSRQYADGKLITGVVVPEFEKLNAKHYRDEAQAIAEQMAATIKGDKGDKGDTGTAGKSAYELYVQNGGMLTLERWLASLRASPPAYAATVDEMTDTTKLYVLPDGYIYAYLKTMIPGGPAYINLATAFQSGYRLNSSGTTTAEAGATTCTDYIPFTPGTVVRIKGFGALLDYNISVYLTNQAIASNGKANAQGGYVSYAYDIASGIVTLTSVSQAIAYLRVSGILSGTTADVIITVNEEIKNSDPVESYEWGSTGLAFVPADYEDRIIELEEDVLVLQNDVEALGNTPSEAVTIPSYWADMVADKTATIKGLQEAGGKDCVCFAWASDTHIPDNDTGRTTDIGKVMAKMLDNCEIPFAMISGDIATRASYPTEEEYLEKLEELPVHLYPLWGTDRLLMALGNHDGCWGDSSGYYRHQFTPERMWQVYFRGQALDFRRVFSDDGLYYYVDNIAQRTRIIVLNSNFGGEYAVDGNGWAVNNRFGTSCYGQEQLDWLADIALNMPSSYSAVIVAHVSPNINYTVDKAQLIGIINAYCNKTTFSGSYTAGVAGWSNSTVSVDFTSAQGEIIAMFTGHVHGDSIDTTTLVCPLITILSAGASANSPYDESAPTRTSGTDTETSFDIVTIDRKERLIHTTRLGAGSDRQVDY